MLGPLPEAAQVYRERSPIYFIEHIQDAIAIFQGEIDNVVPRAQSDTVVASLQQRGIPHLYQVYPGEGHGWRKSETIEHFYKTVESFLREKVIFA
jgi:dipeptidyl aminopeptidase/acylaminoacyl peptidase